jgi:hypothetical protein
VLIALSSDASRVATAAPTHEIFAVTEVDALVDVVLDCANAGTASTATEKAAIATVETVRASFL